jgi:hypothetical protein
MFGLIAFPVVSFSQTSRSLDVGGIEVTLGEPMTSVLERLTRVYDVKFQDATSTGDSKNWSVFRKRVSPTDSYDGVGDVTARGGVVTWISKVTFVDDGDVSRIWVKWNSEMTRRSRSQCTTEPSLFTNGGQTYLGGFTTKCGLYGLWVSIPNKMGGTVFDGRTTVQMTAKSP